jgi:hypothetical protein
MSDNPADVAGANWPTGTRANESSARNAARHRKRSARVRQLRIRGTADERARQGASSSGKKQEAEEGPGFGPMTRHTRAWG